jgi:hypothetical protein
MCTNHQEQKIRLQLYVTGEFSMHHLGQKQNTALQSFTQHTSKPDSVEYIFPCHWMSILPGLTVSASILIHKALQSLFRWQIQSQFGN